MKIKPAPTLGGVVVELGPNEQAIPSAEINAGSGSEPRFKLEHILVPVDFSECSKKAMRYAVPFAEQFGARLHLLYVGQGYYLVPELAPLDLSAERTDVVGELATLARENIAQDIPVDILVRKGHPATEIVNVAKEVGAGLIIISTHGYTGLKHVWFGSATEDVVRHAPCPVLVVRETEQEFVQGEDR